MAFVLATGPGGAAWADDRPASAPLAWLDNAELIDLHMGSALSDKVQGLRRGGFELADGTPMRFDPWYEAGWRDLSVSFLTQIGAGFGLYWGFSSGESGVKYVIDPGAKLGFILQDAPTAQTTLTLSGTFSLWGRLKERTCIADYGEIGGVQTVNCRMVASPLPPSETLNFLLNESPPDWGQIGLTWAYRF